jgi:small subunit ribosomal protein S21
MLEIGEFYFWNLYKPEVKFPRLYRINQENHSVQNSGNNQNDIQKAERVSSAKLEPLAVTVETNLDKAMKILKRKLIKEGLFKELKTRRYFEKPSEKKKRKMKETMKKLRKEEARARKNSMI